MQDDITKGRTLYYSFLGNFLDFNTFKDHEKDFIKALEVMKENPLDEDEGRSLKELLEFFKNKDFEDIYNESYTQTFLFKKISLFYSFYKDRTSGLQGKEFLKLRQYLKRYSFEIRKDFKESEEHVAFLFLFMEYLLKNGFDEREQKNFFFAFLDPCIKGLCAQKDEFENIWKSYISILQSFYNFEKEFLNN